ncbi:MCP four helix bundle domain-containing protein [Dyadobacter sp. CY312]|uniref:MCP four helix bundle domain-containing protein n=1 Tax=Dyadobacter sp. CY312 TaxID=2907303 RepID=UPI001F27EC65|nr:MCP four helix bundle domain-containing protein [Dyadobacter sp. CY312]MCE7040958.1 MCP four helix bundle domain-containing protein [Dyadobacter sp. CY312]
MKWSFVIRQKLKAALLLSGIMAFIILGSLIARNSMEGIDKSFSSIYQDRLIPATTIIYLTENLYGKRLSLEKFLLSDDQRTSHEISSGLSLYDSRIDSLISAFEKTYLVDQEAKSLAAFKNRVEEYVLLEKMILNLHASGHVDAGKKLFEGAGANTFQSTINNLNELTSIQSNIGQELVKESKSDMASFGLISFLQIALAIIIGLIVLVLIQNSKIINKPKIRQDEGSYFNLN